jgi:dihydroorotate dehydrogenase electron transfer subunit
MHQLKTEMISNECVAEDIFKMSVAVGPVAGEILPGQFVQIKCSDSLYPLLRRPFSVHRIGDEHIEIFYKVVGGGTKLLSLKKAGEKIDMLCPLGNGFTINQNIETVILIAGGMGFAPLTALAEQIKRLVPGRKIYALLGAETKKEILCARDFSQIGAEILITTEDGSLGKKGFITDIFCQFAGECPPQDVEIYACGPNAMLKIVSQISAKCNLSCQVSLERHMACGIGVCMGCAVKTKSGYKPACKDGPVFDAKELEW